MRWKFNAISIKILLALFTKIEKQSKSLWNHTDPKEPMQS
jgi:hypothetical protein